MSLLSAHIDVLSELLLRFVTALLLWSWKRTLLVAVSHQTVAGFMWHGPAFVWNSNSGLSPTLSGGWTELVSDMLQYELEVRNDTF